MADPSGCSFHDLAHYLARRHEKGLHEGARNHCVCCCLFLQFCFSAPRRNRTYNLVIKSHLLCQLS
jgi:hypothetical protein